MAEDWIIPVIGHVFVLNLVRSIIEYIGIIDVSNIYKRRRCFMFRKKLQQRALQYISFRLITAYETSINCVYNQRTRFIMCIASNPGGPDRD